MQKQRLARPARNTCLLALGVLTLGIAACGSSSEPASERRPAPTQAVDSDAVDTMPVNAPGTVDPDGPDPLPTVAPAVVDQEQAVLRTVATLAFEHYSAALDGARSMRAAVDAFVAEPTDAALAVAREAWLAARPAYIRTEALRFSSGPIDGADVDVEGFLNAWPLDEVYVDSLIAGDEQVSEDMLRAANENGGERNISTGWHAIEYLLWGVDTDPAGPGDRPASDFVGGGATPTRMRQYLAVATGMLVGDLGRVVAAWEPESGPYLEELFGLDTGEGLTRVLTGIGTLAGGELFGERLAVPYDTKDSEDEHSCFSDNTTVDHHMDAQSVRAVYLGLDPAGVKIGPSVADVVATTDPELDAAIRAGLDAAVAATGAIPAPFDQAILGTDEAPGRVAIKAALDALDRLTQDLVTAGRELGIQIGTEVP